MNTRNNLVSEAASGGISWRIGLGLAVVLLVGIALRGLRLHDGLWMDEGISVTFVTQAHGLGDLLTALSTTVLSERLQQLYVILLYYWCAVFGDSTPALRIFSLLPSLGTILALADAARRLHGWRSGLWAALLASGSAYLIYFGMEIRASALLIFLMTVFLDGWIADRLSPMGGRRPGLVSAVAAALLCLGSIYGFMPLAAIALADARLRRDTRRWWRFWLPVAIACAVVMLVLYVPVILRGDIRSYAGVVHSQGLAQSILFVIYGITVGQSYGPPLEALHGAGRLALLLHFGPQLLLYAAVMAVLVIGIIRTLRHADRTDLLPDLALAFVIALLLGAVAGWVQDLNWLPRHAFYLAPLFILLLAVTIARSRSWWVAAAPASLLVALNLVAVANANFAEAYALDDYRGVALVLRSAPVRDAVPVMLSGNLNLLRDYYGIDRLADGRDIRAGTLDALLPQMTGDAHDVEVVLNREYYWTGGADKTFADVYTGAAYTVSEHRHLVYFDLYHLTRK